ncbi:MAG: hypothetical protein HZA61_02990 [Candidatus Eisenbacteria bacterium]|uniref:Zf-HC2 domain-containing protein n=1 Tax=Eiseniibacteriota bacterium TaxID=2212470 RepID=A0A933W7H1_UNCEI|nr:hypothetical protein [Candidatus Eisenbacteria bacterium]
MTPNLDAREAHLSDALCADLVLGLLEGLERERALEHTRTCVECEDRLRAHAAASERAQADWAAKISATPVALRPRFALPLPAIFAAAAALVAVLSLPLVMRQGSREELAPQWLPASGDVVRLRGEGAPDTHLTAGLAAYEARDLDTAERELKAARAEGASETLRRLYLGHVLVARGRAQEAAAVLGDVRWWEVPEPWRQEGARTWAQALRTVGDFARADSVERSLQPDSLLRP